MDTGIGSSELARIDESGFRLLDRASDAADEEEEDGNVLESV